MPPSTFLRTPALASVTLRHTARAGLHNLAAVVKPIMSTQLEASGGSDEAAGSEAERDDVVQPTLRTGRAIQYFSNF